MDALLLDSQWIWHPQWIDYAEDSAGAFVNFRKNLSLSDIPSQPVKILITADTRYKLYINDGLVSFGPVKGDDRLWFYDELDIQPYLRIGINQIKVRVLRFYHATPYATSFPRLPQPGLLIRPSNTKGDITVATDGSWQAAIDRSTKLSIDIQEDDFLHVYEDVNAKDGLHMKWLPAEELKFPTSHGLSMPWKLCSRMIPSPKLESSCFVAIHNPQSIYCLLQWKELLLGGKGLREPLRLGPGTSHHLELEVAHHTTALLRFRFARPSSSGSNIKVTYSEAYEDTPYQIPYLRSKNDRKDTQKTLMGPYDKYIFAGQSLNHQNSDQDTIPHHAIEEIFAPFHYRTFRFVSLDIEVDQASDLVMHGIDVTTINYPLDVLATFTAKEQETGNYGDLWRTSKRTLQNCMHDCYEDCPFYEQFQYAMDSRSSALFTYSISGDDRMARQAIVQLHNSYNAAIGLTASRAPSHQPQVIPHFSLFWVCMITDHFTYFRDADFTSRFIPECISVMESFARRIDSKFGLVRSLGPSAHWDFVDWTDSWRPMGIPPAGERTGFLSYTNMLYIFTLKQLAVVLTALHRPGAAADCHSRAGSIVTALQQYCFDGRFFTDGLSQGARKSEDYSQQSQVWAVLCGAAEGPSARDILSECLSTPTSPASPTHMTTKKQEFTPASLAMSFYTLRALSVAGRDIYSAHFHRFWDPWRAQLAQNLTTWCEDSVSQRSDCHAWGCAPLYEFTAEVAGIRPGAPGWSIVDFEPRIELFEQAEFEVPIGVRNGAMGGGMARVEWWGSRGNETQKQTETDGSEETCSCDGKNVTLSLKWDRTEVHHVPVRIMAGHSRVEEVEVGKGLSFWVCGKSCAKPRPLSISIAGRAAEK